MSRPIRLEEQALSVPDVLQQQVDEQESRSQRGFGTFGGVFVPTLLTILGVIMYLRLGWVVGSVGLLSGWLIILIAFAITGFTGLSLSSITTNIRVGAGGAFSMISQSLGLEVGGSIGIPLFFSQALAVTMYVFGFREGWLYIFPDHPALLVDLAVFALVFLIASISAGLAFRVQYVILAMIGFSLASVLVAAFLGSTTESITWGNPPAALTSGPSLPSPFQRLPASWPVPTCPAIWKRRAARSHSAHWARLDSACWSTCCWHIGWPARRRLTS